MIIGIIKWIVISLILIMLVHHLFYFFKNTLTVPKVKDLVHQPSKLYKEIEETLNSKENNTIKLSSVDNNNIDTKEMKNELKNFFNELSQNKHNISSVLGSGSFSQIGESSKNIYSEF